VLRRIDDGAWKRVGPELIETPSFLDTGVQIGRRMGYRVVAVSRSSL